VAVNLSARQLSDPDLLDTVTGVLLDTGLPASRLTLEITETAVMADTALSISRLHDLKALGVRLAIDDFGTGYSSLAYLRQLPLDIVKIDKTFTDVVPHDAEGSILVKAILHLAKTLRLDAVAEGVEDPAQVEGLVRYGCRFGPRLLLRQAAATRRAHRVPPRPDPAAGGRRRGRDGRAVRKSSMPPGARCTARPRLVRGDRRAAAYADRRGQAAVEATQAGRRSALVASPGLSQVAGDSRLL